MRFSVAKCADIVLVWGPFHFSVTPNLVTDPITFEISDGFWVILIVNLSLTMFNTLEERASVS